METDKIDKSKEPLKASIFQKTSFVFTILNISCFSQFSNYQFLGSSMRGLEIDLSLSSRKLSLLVLAETVSNLFAMPIWGVFADLYEIKWVLMFSLFFSGIFVISLGFVNDFYSMFLLRVLNGSMMGSVIPISQKFVAVSNIKNSGYANGLLHSFSNIGRLVCSIIVSTLSSNVYSEMYGWRICAFAIGSSCILSSFLAILIPRMKPKKYRKSLYDLINLDENPNFSSAFHAILNRLYGIMSIRTVKILTIGIFLGQGPYTVAYFLILYLQYCRISNFKSGLVSAFIVFGSAFGGLLGALFADRIHNKFPRYGRLLTGLISTFIRLICSCFTLFYLTFDRIKKLYPLLLFIFFIIGVTMASLGSVDRSIFSDVVMPSEQSFGIGSALFISGVTSGLIFPPVFSFFLKVVFHYQDNDKDIADLPDSFVRKNAFALRNSFAILLIFSTVCTLFMYIFLLNTYYDDAQGIKEKIDKKTKFSKVKVVTDSSFDTVSRMDTSDFRE